MSAAEAGPRGRRSFCSMAGSKTYSFVDVAPILAAEGYRVIIPYLRGYGATRFQSDSTLRSGQPSAVDTVAMMDALTIEKATLAGFDWAARTANIIAALWPERCKAMVSVSGYLIGKSGGGCTKTSAEYDHGTAGSSVS
jgi:pimeloyl-ACP methyl ester carboxylesterase